MKRMICDCQNTGGAPHQGCRYTGKQTYPSLFSRCRTLIGATIQILDSPMELEATVSDYWTRHDSWLNVEGENWVVWQSSGDDAENRRWIERINEAVEENLVRGAIGIIRSTKKELSDNYLNGFECLVTIPVGSVEVKQAGSLPPNCRTSEHKEHLIHVIYTGALNVQDRRVCVNDVVAFMDELKQMEGAKVRHDAWTRLLNEARTQRLGQAADWANAVADDISRMKRNTHYFYGLWDESMKQRLVEWGMYEGKLLAKFTKECTKRTLKAVYDSFRFVKPEIPYQLYWAAFNLLDE